MTAAARVDATGTPGVGAGQPDTTRRRATDPRPLRVVRPPVELVDSDDDFDFQHLPRRR